MALSDKKVRPIRITYVITDLEVGGVPLHLYRLTTLLPCDRFHVVVISLTRTGPVGEMLLTAGVPVFECRARRVWDLRALLRLWGLLRRRPPDILHSLLFHANTACRVTGPAAGVPVGRILCEIQTAEVERPWHLVLDNLTCRWCRCEIGNSPSVVEHLHRHAHVPRSRLICQWGAVDVGAIESACPAARAAFDLPEGEPVIIWTGRLDPVKGFEEMMAAFAGLCRSRPSWLVLVGEGAYRPAIEALIERHGLQSRVRLLGQRSDVPSLLKMADAFLLCSRTEGLPNAVLEAMAAGLPIVATDVPGCRDVVKDGVTGLLARPGDAGDIERQLRRLLSDPAEAKARARRAKSFVNEHLNVADLARRWAAVYEAINGTNENTVQLTERGKSRSC